jgi:carbonic anhydrase
MLAAVLHALGKRPLFEEFPDPTLGEGEVFLHVCAAALRPVDKQLADMESTMPAPANFLSFACGLMHTSKQDLRTRIQPRTGTVAVAPAFFYAFQNIEENVRHQLQKLRTHPWIPESVAVRGFVYDVASGRLREIKDARADRYPRNCPELNSNRLE